MRGIEYEANRGLEQADITYLVICDNPLHQSVMEPLQGEWLSVSSCWCRACHTCLFIPGLELLANHSVLPLLLMVLMEVRPYSGSHAITILPYLPPPRFARRHAGHTAKFEY